MISDLYTILDTILNFDFRFLIFEAHHKNCRWFWIERVFWNGDSNPLRAPDRDSALAIEFSISFSHSHSPHFIWNVVNQNSQKKLRRTKVERRKSSRLKVKNNKMGQEFVFGCKGMKKSVGFWILDFPHSPPKNYKLQATT